MTRPLTQEIAEGYGYGKKPFKEWTRKYFDSLDIEKRMNQIKPIQQFILDEMGFTSALTKEMEKYVLDPNGVGSNLILNPNYIYILKSKGKPIADYFPPLFKGESSPAKVSSYVPIEMPFQYRGKGQYMLGIYDKVGNDWGNSYTDRGFNTFSYEIIGTLKFPSQVEFLNWGIEDPFNLK